MSARRAIVLLAMASFAIASACSLNPQPFPPGSPDGSFADDAGFKDAAGGFGDASVSDVGAPPPNDAAAADAGDASEEDASDAAPDAETDAATDAAADADLDAADDASDASNE